MESSVLYTQEVAESFGLRNKTFSREDVAAATGYMRGEDAQAVARKRQMQAAAAGGGYVDLDDEDDM